MTNLILAFLISTFAYAKGSVATSGFTSSEAGAELTPKEFASRFQVSGELFVTSADGRRLLYKISESRTSTPAEDTTDISSTWGHTHKFGDKSIGIFIRYAFHIGNDGSVSAHIQQFESMKPDNLGGNVKFGKLIHEEKMDLTDFGPINWVAYKDGQKRIVARITPLLLDRGNSFGPDNMPIALEQAVLVDGNGKLWGDDLSEGGGKYVAMATRYGTLALSYYPFSGAKELGVAKGSEMLLKSIKPSLTLRNSRPFLSANGEFKVYGLVLPERKTTNLHSVHMIVSDKEEEFIQGLK